MAKTKPKTTVQSVERAARLLLLVATSEEQITATRAAEHFGLSLPTTYHLLATLVSEGLLSKESGRRYRLGPKAAVIADAVARDQSAPESYLRHLRKLADATEETVYLSAWRGGEICVLSTIEGEHAVRVAGIETGVTGFEHARASGKLLMALAKPEVRDPLLSGRLAKRTPNTITTREALAKEFETIRREGFAVDREEFSLGVTCISAPITENGVAVAACTISVPTERFREREDSLREALISAADAASGEAD
jgi:DNA-binding IclR family transcriptional regulator